MDAEVEPAGRRRQQPAPAKIAARVARALLDGAVGRIEGVTLLNPGFFDLERLRSGSVAKKRGVTRRRAK